MLLFISAVGLNLAPIGLSLENQLQKIKDNFLDLFQQYSNDLQDMEIVIHEVHCWVIKWQNTLYAVDLADTLKEALLHANNLLFPNIHVIFKVKLYHSITT